MKVINVIQRNEAISTLEWTIHHQYTIFEPNEIKSVSCSQRNILHLDVFVSPSTHLSLYGEQNSCGQFLQLTHPIQPTSSAVCT
jgi:hypothetical protein